MLYRGLFLLMFGMPLVGFSQTPKVDPCKIYGNIYIETVNKSLANYRVFIEENESFADLVVFKQKSRLFADRVGQWNFVSDKSFADFIIYFEDVKGFANFSIYYTEQEGFAGCKQ